MHVFVIVAQKRMRFSLDPVSSIVDLLDAVANVNACCRVTSLCIDHQPRANRFIWSWLGAAVAQGVYTAGEPTPRPRTSLVPVTGPWY